MRLWHVGQLWDLLSFQYWGFILHWVLETMTSTRMALPINRRLAFGEFNGTKYVDGTLVFHGSNKRFILAPPTGWAGPDKHNALDLVIEQLQSRNLSPKFSRTTAYKIMKNTRVSTNPNPNKKGKTP